MKKLFSLLLAIVLLVSPIITYAEEEKATKIDLSDYKTMNFKETLADEEMELSYKDYEESSDQVTIYMFRGKGCGYCRSFLTFLNSISEEYGKYFKVVSFESWYDEANASLLETISSFLEDPAGGVPYIIIGNKVFPGYADSYDETIKEKIMSEYEAENKYDVIEAYNDSIKFHLSQTATIVLWNLFFMAIATCAVILYIKKSNEKLMKFINKKEAKKEMKDETVIKSNRKIVTHDVVKKAARKKNVKKK